MLLDKFFHIKEIRQDGKHIVSIRMNPEHEVYQGHFPGLPVAPGVCLVQMAKESLEQITGKLLSMDSCSNIKFTAVVDPNIQTDLTLEMDIEPVSDTGYLMSCSLTDGEVKYLSLKGNYSVRG